MFRSMLVGVAGSLAIAGAASAEPFDSFKDLCLSTNGDRSAAHAAAKQARWSELPMEALGGEANAEFQEQTVHVNFDPTGVSEPPASMETMLTGWADGEAMLETENIVLEICSILSPQMNMAQNLARLTDLLGEAVDDPEGQAIWIYSRDGDRFVSEAALADLEEGDIETIAGERDLYMVFATEENGAGVLMLGAVRSVLRLRAGG